MKFLVVGGSCFLLTMVINYGLRLTVCQSKPLVALTVANVVSTVASYFLNRQWSFRSEGTHKELIPFAVVSGIAIGVNDLPMTVSRYLLDLRTPYVSGFTQEVSDFLAGMILGTLVAMAFRYWAMKKFVFTTQASGAGQAEPAAQPAAEMR
ncbi:GtrA family protein [Kitasatospora sp. NPDC052896]|uniref:GtrA family protein n=1 Tax=Kitasatospora sp. NPDC052896 TaxID=3364061 RepID=UPI0037C77141